MTHIEFYIAWGTVAAYGLTFIVGVATGFVVACGSIFGWK